MKTYTRWLSSIAAMVCLFLLATCQGNKQASLTPTPTLSVQVTPANSPQILHQSPIQGQRLELAPTIQITFDRAMNQGKTAAAWSVVDGSNQPVAGALSWLNDRTLQYKPDQTLLPAKPYSALLSTGAEGADGNSLATTIRIEFKTTDALVVGQVFPADAANSVDIKSAVTVIFNKPVVPLMSLEDQANLASPIEISPAVAGSGQWVSSSVYVYQPTTGLASGTAYMVRVNSGLEDTTGSALEQDYVWGFMTGSPKVTNFSLKDTGKAQDNKSILLNQAFVLTFNQAMDEKSVGAACHLRNRETQADFPVKLSWLDGDTNLTIEPVGRYNVASFYDLTIASSAKAQEGGTLQESYQQQLTTIPLPRVNAVFPQSGKQSSFSNSMYVDFASPMNINSFKGRVVISPQPRQPVELNYDDGQDRLYVYGLEPSTKYVVRLLPGMADIYGFTINSDYSFDFETAGLDPTAGLLVPYYPLVYRTKGEKPVFFEYTNLTAASISLYSLSYQEFASLLQDSSQLTSLDNSSKTPLEQWTPALTADKDAVGRIKLDLEANRHLDPGYYFIGMTADPVDRTARYNQGVLFIVAPAALTLKASQSEALAWLVDQETGQPVPNVPVVFYNDKMAVVGQAQTDADGLAYVQNVSNVQYARSDDPAHLAMIALDWGSGVSEGQFGIWTDFYSPVSSKFAYVYTDRALYRPGQTVFYKGIVRSNDDLHYSLPGLKTVDVTIDDDQGKLYQGAVSLTQDGSFSGSFPVGADAQVGNYNISVRQAAGDESTLGNVPFRVADYVKPEFQVTTDVTPATAVVGDPVKFSLQAAYYSGGNVSNAQVQWFMQTTPTEYNPPDQNNQYSFSDYDYSNNYA